MGTLGIGGSLALVLNMTPAPALWDQAVRCRRSSAIYWSASRSLPATRSMRFDRWESMNIPRVQGLDGTKTRQTLDSSFEFRYLHQQPCDSGERRVRSG